MLHSIAMVAWYSTGNAYKKWKTTGRFQKSFGGVNPNTLICMFWEMQPIKINIKKFQNPWITPTLSRNPDCDAIIIGWPPNLSSKYVKTGKKP